MMDRDYEETPPRQAIQRIRYTHDAMIDLLLSNPAISQGDLAEAFGYSASWVSSIMSSDAFRARFAERRAEIIDPALADRVRVNFEAMVLRSQAILMEKLAAPAERVSDSLALKAFELSTRAAGYGLRQAPTVQVNVTDHLTTLQTNITKMLREARPEDLEDSADEE